MNNPVLERMTKKIDELKSIVETLNTSVELIDSTTGSYQLIADNVKATRLEVEKEYKDVLAIHKKTDDLGAKVLLALEEIARKAELS